MAPKRPSRLLEDPPSASPSQEHEEEEELEESQVEESVEEKSEEEEEEENEIIQKTAQISKLSQNQPRDESYEEEEEGFETENDNTKHSPTASSFMIKPAVTMNNHYVEPKKTTVKRALVNGKERKDTPKKTKAPKDHTQDDRVGTPKKVGSAGGRVWNSDDVIAILEGIIDYQKQKGADPNADMGAFLEFVKGSFGFEVTKTQLYEKVRSLKKKFFANLGKGESFIPAKPHDTECFELSKKIWGNNNVAAGEGNIGSNPNDGVVANGVDHTEHEHVKIVDGELVTKKSSKGKSSEGKRREKGEKKKKLSEKKNKKKMDNGPNIVEKEAEDVTEKEDVVMDDENVVEKEFEPVTYNEDVVKDYEVVVPKEAEPVTDDEDVMKDREDVVMDDENHVSDDENIANDTAQNISVKYPNFFASLNLDMPENQRNLMMEGICLVKSEKARELEDRWKELKMKEAEFFCRKMELIAEQSRLVVDAMKQNR